ncbi:MAG: hypothetical protein JSS76_10620 [Bacteroidetes bacterium]|nr:hypothetical protein [Bacteroidota bacterium]
MKYCPLICAFLVLLVSCRPHIQETDTISERGPDSLYAAYLVMARSLPDSLGRIAPYVATERDSGALYEVLDSPYLAIGRLIDTVHTFAVSCANGKNDNTALLRVYKYDGGWRQIAKHVFHYPVQYISYINADSDRRYYEIMVAGTGDADSNKVHAIYQYDPESAIVGFAGDFFCGDEEIGERDGASGYRIDGQHDLIWVDYEGGSNGTGKYEYLWRDHALVLLREAHIDLLPRDGHSAMRSMQIPAKAARRQTFL